jgi:hypothetical protein
MKLYMIDHNSGGWGEHRQLVLAESEEQAHALTKCTRKLGKRYGECEVELLPCDLTTPGCVWEYYEGDD